MPQRAPDAGEATQQMNRQLLLLLLALSGSALSRGLRGNADRATTGGDSYLAADETAGGTFQPGGDR